MTTLLKGENDENPKNKGGIAMKKLLAAPYARFSAMTDKDRRKKAPQKIPPGKNQGKRDRR